MVPLIHFDRSIVHFTAVISMEPAISTAPAISPLPVVRISASGRTGSCAMIAAKAIPLWTMIVQASNQSCEA
ncbi:hypothetical protein C7402_103493 [Paraburkholderia unamae]|uniref:Uncharacterized protein n=1 Tax=Paraburkholderia unamae TaxID=219649 RepID=A0ABX5KWP2_9BURK|nr:hypothetical protein C7402_103493 [Paraburkholderia unamae]